MYRAKLAEAYRAAGEPAAFRREAEAALRLDQLTPHPDKKLPAELRSRLRCRRPPAMRKLTAGFLPWRRPAEPDRMNLSQ